MAVRQDTFINGSSPNVQDSFLNSVKDEINNAIGYFKPLDSGDREQLAQSIFASMLGGMSLKANEITSTGTVLYLEFNKFNKSVIPEGFSFFDGMSLLFNNKSLVNTGNVDIYILDRGPYNLLDFNGNELEAGELCPGHYEIVWDSTLEAFLLYSEVADKIIDKNFISGLIPSNSLTNPDEDMSITSGKALCKDCSTIVNLDSDIVLSMPSLLETSLANSSSYHLFLYKKNDGTNQWKLSTSKDPTISDIKSANAYRRIRSFKTDSSGDIVNEIHTTERGNGRIFHRFNSMIPETSAYPSSINSLFALASVPEGEIFNAYLNQQIDNGVAYIGEGYGSNSYETMQQNGGGGGTANLFIETNTSRQIRHGAASGSQYGLNILGYEDYRLNN